MQEEKDRVRIVTAQSAANRFLEAKAQALSAELERTRKRNERIHWYRTNAANIKLIVTDDCHEVLECDYELTVIMKTGRVFKGIEDMRVADFVRGLAVPQCKLSELRRFESGVH